MTNITSPVKSQTLAALKNVAACMGLVTRLQNRGPHLPGLGVFHGPSGYGKSYASIYAQNKTRAIRVEVGDSWTRRTFLRAILREGGISEPRGAVADLAEQAIMILGEDPSRPLIIDEADRLVTKNMIELVRELHEHSQAPIVLIGEENLPGKLIASERTHNRVLEWTAAMPCDLEDTKKLADIFLRDLNCSDAFLDNIRRESDGRARRIVVNLSRIAEWARNRGAKAVDAYDADLYTGTPPSRRAATQRRAS